MTRVLKAAVVSAAACAAILAPSGAAFATDNGNEGHHSEAAAHENHNEDNGAHDESRDSHDNDNKDDDRDDNRDDDHDDDDDDRDDYDDKDDDDDDNRRNDHREYDKDDHRKYNKDDHSRQSYEGGDSLAEGYAIGSPGILSGNVVQVPITVPINVCGNTISIIGLLNPAAGNTCANQVN